MKRGRSYLDLRYKFIRGLIEYEGYQRNCVYLKSAAEWTSKAIISLELSQEPVKSVNQAAKLEGIGKELSEKLKEMTGFKHLSNKAPPAGMFVSSAPAFLVAMLNLTEVQSLQDNSPKENILIPEAMLIEEAAKLCEEKFNHIPKAFCMAAWRLNVLCNRDLIKKRSLAQTPVYQLLPLGEEEATRLRATFQPSSTQKTGSNMAEKEEDQQCGTLYTNDDGSDGLVILVDTQEFGGDHRGLGQLIDLIKQTGLRYRTKKLACGDYSWLLRCGGEERVMPLLVERKRADDLAKSLVDGRYGKQRRDMVKWKAAFTSQGVPAVLKYILESRPEQFVVQCADGCGGVGKCGYPSALQLNKAIEDLENCQDFEVLKTDNIGHTVEMLAIITAELQQRSDCGEFDDLIMKDINPDQFMSTRIESAATGSEGSERGNTSAKANNFKKRHKTSATVTSEEPSMSHWADELLVDASVDQHKTRDSVKHTESNDDDDENSIFRKSQLLSGDYEKLPNVTEKQTMKVRPQQSNNSRSQQEKNNNYLTVEEDEAPIQLAQYHSTPGTSVNVPLVKKPKPVPTIHIQEGVLPKIIGRYQPESDTAQPTTTIKAGPSMQGAFKTGENYNKTPWVRPPVSSSLGSASAVPKVLGNPHKAITAGSESVTADDDNFAASSVSVTGKQHKPATTITRKAFSDTSNITEQKATSPGVPRRVPKLKMSYHLNSPEVTPSSTASTPSSSIGARIYLMKTPPGKGASSSPKSPPSTGAPEGGKGQVAVRRTVFSELSDDDSNQGLPDLTTYSTSKGPRVKKTKIETASSVLTDFHSVKYGSNASSDKSCSMTAQCNNERLQVEFDNKVQTLLGILPHVSQERAISALLDCNIDVERCVSVLLDEEEAGGPSSVVDLT
ncbi:uncharacterized protein LOC106168870 [Lingula anatina]|uniref:Crossover junction endonuclease MUS81 n=1 Tax=Lingula anatina TaxID=7574 RepID=A0A1S3IZU4_LINAN|nr:uncharacterized protein LOC106168870 [Lingula anatina]|eukprot:XP_013403533.1 uncharacterized protein LOC106168870 [Lingula anatina]